MEYDMDIAELGILADRHVRESAENLPREIDNLRQML